MKREDFFKRIKSTCPDKKTYAIELLKIRGFLFEERKQGIYLSDNSHNQDVIFLMEILGEKCIAKNNRISIDDEFDITNIETLFDENIQVSFPVQWGTEPQWNYFCLREHGYKAYVKDLEPFVARYVKSISACGVVTVGSCDGNHPNKDELYIMFYDECSKVWHELIWECFLADKFNLKWNKMCTAIHFDENTKYETYYEINRAAAYLYENRKLIRKIKREIVNCIPVTFRKKQTSDVVENAFIEKSKIRFNEYKEKVNLNE